MSVFAAEGKARTFDYRAGDVGYVPRNPGQGSTTYDAIRRRLILGGGGRWTDAVGGRTDGAERGHPADTDPPILDHNLVPEPPPEKSAGPVRPGRGSQLTNQVAYRGRAADRTADRGRVRGNRGRRRRP